MVGISQFLLVMLLAVVILVVLIIKFNVHPVMALFISGMFTGIGFGYAVDKTINLFVEGFGLSLIHIQMCIRDRLKITLVKSPIGAIPKQKATVEALGLKKVNKTVEMPDNDAVRGMIWHVRHLVKVEEI